MAQQSKSEKHFDAIIALIRGGMTGAAACASDPDFPSYRTLTEWATKHGRKDAISAAWRQREKSDGARLKTNEKYSPAQWQAVLDVFEQNPRKSQRDLDAILTAAALPSRRLIQHKRQRDADFDARFKAVANIKRKRAGRPDPAPPAPVYRSHELRRLLMADPIFAAAARAVPRKFDPDVRDDLISEIALGLIEGRLITDQIGYDTVGETLKKMRFRFDSLDSPAIDGDDRTTKIAALPNPCAVVAW